MEVAKESGVSQSMISKIRNGVLTDPPADVCIKILNAYGYGVTLKRPKKRRSRK
jgi:transcriptional regulator with XRE-family HTH domain